MKSRTAILLVALIFLPCSIFLPFLGGALFHASFAAGLAWLYWLVDRENERLHKALDNCSRDVARNLKLQAAERGVHAASPSDRRTTFPRV